MSQYVPRINHLKMIWPLDFLQDDEEQREGPDVISAEGRRRLLAYFGLQIVFAVAVTFAACAFLAVGSANSNNNSPFYNSNVGTIVITQRLFKPGDFSASDYNDDELAFSKSKQLQ